ncbi:LexA family protein [Vibrio navarrensis]|uniref:LexA family protein n=1 Tax=Vibrio navarrensis TaxID=29495 RepID=UPI00186A0778|nr:S24 family peptidase [Vibrio navarrensis]MCU8386668.1 S24 family peptidase [Vibrio vulnificus]
MKTAEEIRVDNARYLAKLAGGTSAFANKIDRSSTQASRFMGTNPTTAIGPKMARHIESCFDKPDGWLDVDHGLGNYSKQAFSDRLNSACEEAGIPERGRAAYLQSKLPSKISLVSIRKWLLGEAQPDRERVDELAELLETTAEKLLALEIEDRKPKVLVIEEPRVSYDFYYKSDIHQAPLISWVQAGDFCNSETQISPHDCELIPCPNKKASKRTFALTVVGDSMTSPYGRSYPEGTIIFVDPEKVAEPNMRVVAKADSGYTFKQLKINEMGQRYLKPLNPHHQPIFDEKLEICGVVIGSYTQDI